MATAAGRPAGASSCSGTPSAARFGAPATAGTATTSTNPTRDAASATCSRKCVELGSGPVGETAKRAGRDPWLRQSPQASTAPSDRELQDQLWLAAMRSDSDPAPLSSPQQQLLLPSPPPPSEPRASRSPRPPSGSQQQQQQQQPSSVSDRTAQSGLMPPFYRRRASGWLRAYQEVAESRYCMVYRPTIVRTSY
jgi:hypothetical protein